MKKALFYVLLFVLTLQATAQHGIIINRSNSNNQVSVNTDNADLPVVQRTSNTSGSAKPDTNKRITIWMELGDGYYTSDAGSTPSIIGSQSHFTFLLSTKLYDTTKDLKPLPTRITYNNTPIVSSSSTTGTATNIRTQYLGSDTRLKITPNNFDIVPGDTMAFAIGYRVNVDVDPAQIKNGNKPPKATKLWFFYNNNTAFNALSSNGVLVGAEDPILFCRTHNSETIGFPALPGTIDEDIYGEKYNNCISFSLPEVSDFSERNVFVSLIPKTDLELGKSSSVYVVLTDDNDNVIATDIIPNMRFAPAHDPNYIVQRPACLLFPRKAVPFTYTVHFQNTGEGDADGVKMLVHLPTGMDLNSFNPATDILEASFAGKNAKSSITVTIDKTNNILKVLFVPVGGQNLSGTNVPNPASNPLTMGEITFRLKSTKNTEDSLEAHAEIYFHSVHPSNKATRNPGQYEDPVITNIAITRYKTCCVGCPDPDPGCKTFLGLCRWYWVIILLALTGLIWFIIARRRRKKKNQPPYQP